MLSAVATMAIRIMNLEKDFLPSLESRLAINMGRFNSPIISECKIGNFLGVLGGLRVIGLDANYLKCGCDEPGIGQCWNVLGIM